MRTLSRPQSVAARQAAARQCSSPTGRPTVATSGRTASTMPRASCTSRCAARRSAPALPRASATCSRPSGTAASRCRRCRAARPSSRAASRSDRPTPPCARACWPPSRLEQRRRRSRAGPS
eukprot:5802890-Prymnesium_polylepis.1